MSDLEVWRQNLIRPNVLDTTVLVARTKSDRGSLASVTDDTSASSSRPPTRASLPDHADLDLDVTVVHVMRCRLVLRDRCRPSVIPTAGYGTDRGLHDDGVTQESERQGGFKSCVTFPN